MAKSIKKQCEEFLEYIIETCYQAMDMDSGIGAYWLKGECEKRMAALKETCPPGDKKGGKTKN